jgi:hypothetical protein
MGVHRVVAVIAERIAHRVRHDDRTGAISAATRDRSPQSPITSDAPDATAQSKPVARLSSTTTRSPASTSA